VRERRIRRKIPLPRGQWHLLWNEQKNLKRRVRGGRREEFKSEPKRHLPSYTICQRGQKSLKHRGTEETETNADDGIEILSFSCNSLLPLCLCVSNLFLNSFSLVAAEWPRFDFRVFNFFFAK